MRVLVTGSRTWSDYKPIFDALSNVLAEHPDMVLVHGGAVGADSAAAAWARIHHVRAECHEAQWATDGRSAGLIRNRAMVNAEADLGLALIRGRSRGASHCADLAEKAGIETRRIPWEGRSGLAETSRDRTSEQE